MNRTKGQIGRTLRRHIRENKWFLIMVGIVLFSRYILVPAFGYNFCEVTGPSMKPTLQPKDIVLIGKCQNFKEGDIIVFHRPVTGELIVHRIIEIENGLIRTKGDNNPFPDSYLIEPSAVIGKVILIIPQGGVYRDIIYLFSVVTLVALIIWEVFVWLRKKLRPSPDKQFRDRGSEDSILLFVSGLLGCLFYN